VEVLAKQRFRLEKSKTYSRTDRGFTRHQSRAVAVSCTTCVPARRSSIRATESTFARGPCR
jgi:hypothetical protein